MKLLTSCTKNVHFTLNNEIYVQNHGIVMGSPLGPILANVYIYGGIRKHWFPDCMNMSRNGDVL